ncbi:MAG TPA: TlpA disulfide reductase family protein [Thermoanaerobaculia bacterium]|nr:TlpA disulfide reductase family protein [Thermoanaerobaculia bacterium]
MPRFELTSLDGAKVNTASLEGKVVLFDFWATWCGPCHEQTKVLKGLYPELREGGVTLLAVNSGEDEETVRSFAARSPFPYPVLLDPRDSLSTQFQVSVLPTLVVIDRHGKVMAFEEGLVDGDSLRETLKRAGA